MTYRELEAAKKQLREEMNAHGYGYINGKHIKPPKEYELRSKELDCIAMINSILAYGGFGYTAEEVMQREERGYHNYLADYVKELGRDRVIALIQGQIDDVVRIRHNVGTDSEGCTYNSIVWKDN